MKIDHNNINAAAKIIAQSRKMIEIDFWDNITYLSFERWLENFQTDEEKYLAASILNNLIYRNRRSIKSMGCNIFNIILPQILEREDIYHIDSIDSWMSDINSSKKARQLPFRTCVIDNVDNKITKSGHVIHTFLQQDFFDKNLGVKLDLLKDNKLPSHVKSIVFFDDMLGSGTQLDNFMIQNNLDDYDIKIIFIPFAAIRESALKIQGKYKNLIIHPVEYLDEQHAFFSPLNNMINRADFYSHEDFKVFYLELCRAKKIETPLGFGDYGLSYVLSNSTPNNNLSLLWFENNNWDRLFKR